MKQENINKTATVKYQGEGFGNSTWEINNINSYCIDNNVVIIKDPNKTLIIPVSSLLSFEIHN